MAFTGREEHNITLEEALEFINRYRQTGNREMIQGAFFGKDAIQSLLDQEGCVGMRYYYGLGSHNEKVLVLVGVDEDENDITGEECVLLEMGKPCPPFCGTSSSPLSQSPE